jgi:hypothetical protein
MSAIRDVLGKLLFAPEVGRSDNPFRLVSSAAPAASRDEVESAWREKELPDDVKSLWETCRSARLFEDADYGQWGLVLLDPQASRERTDAECQARPQDMRADDVVLGEFLGDQELLVIAPSESGRRRVLVALPLDPREDWFGVAEDMAKFLYSFLHAEGNKYWERKNDA